MDVVANCYMLLENKASTMRTVLTSAVILVYMSVFSLQNYENKHVSWRMKST